MKKINKQKEKKRMQKIMQSRIVRKNHNYNFSKISIKYLIKKRSKITKSLALIWLFSLIITGEVITSGKGHLPSQRCEE